MTRIVHRNLTARQVKVLAMLADGKTAADIARSMFVSERTVKHDIDKACNSLDAKNRTHAVALAFKSGILNIGDGGPLATFPLGLALQLVAHSLGYRVEPKRTRAS